MEIIHQFILRATYVMIEFQILHDISLTGYQMCGKGTFPRIWYIRKQNAVVVDSN